jgi:hypothetical protein
MNSDALVSLSPDQIYSVYVIAAVAIIATFVCCIARVSAVAQSLLVHVIPAGIGHYPPEPYAANEPGAPRPLGNSGPIPSHL